MFHNPNRTLSMVFVIGALCGFAVLLVIPTPAQQTTVTRKVLLREDSSIPGYEVDLVAVDIPVGAREGRHTHPGLAMIHVQEGTLTLEHEGKPTANYKAGDNFFVEPGKIHEGRNDGNTPIKILGTFVIKKGMPLTSQVQ